MKKNKLILSIGIGVCIVLSAIVMAIAFSYKEPKHEHVLGDAKTYHVCNNHIYYTKKCQDGCDVAFETKASLTDVMLSITSEDDIVLDEDITLSQELYIKSFSGQDNDVVEIDLNINLDLNGFTLSTDIDEVVNNSVFMFQANRGSVTFNIKNGKIISDDVLYIFRFKNNFTSGENIKVNISNIETLVTGIKATPLFINDCINIDFNATDSKFISVNSTSLDNNYGVGAFINSDSQFSFTDCYFEGGDGLYVKKGIVNLIGCQMVNTGLTYHTIQNTATFSAVGAALVADNYATSNGVTKIIITIINSYMTSNASSVNLYVIKTKASAELALGYNENSIVDVRSCAFNYDPSLMPNDIVQYPNQEGPKRISGTLTWVCGDMEID